MGSPIDEINDGYKFQQIVAEYFRSFKNEEHNLHIKDILVEDNGIGPDEGCDIIIEFCFEDLIHSHTHKWVVECKSQKRAVSDLDIRLNRISAILKKNSANGYLLICRNDATAPLKKTFKELSNVEPYTYVSWNGNELWHRFMQRKSFIKTFFPDYYQRYFIINSSEEQYNSFVEKFEEKFRKDNEK